MTDRARQTTPNPWLTIPPEEYEAHMSSPGVQQQQFLSRVFHTILASLKPACVAVPGCATGNGFEHIDASVSSSVIGIDINPVFLGVLYRRFRHMLPGLQLFCADVSSVVLPSRSVDLVYCALILEYTDPGPVLARIARWLTPDGVCSLVLQLHSPHTATISPTGITSLQRLEPILRLLEPSALLTMMGDLGFYAAAETVHTLSSGKSFYLGEYRLVS
jgi:ubiquinone/menaquinone biosynthesis C-methylase UbiE